MISASEQGLLDRQCFKREAARLSDACCLPGVVGGGGWWWVMVGDGLALVTASVHLVSAQADAISTSFSSCLLKTIREFRVSLGVLGLV